MGRERWIVLFPCEPLFLGRRDDPAVEYQGGGAIMIEGGNPHYRGHASPPRCGSVRWHLAKSVKTS